MVITTLNPAIAPHHIEAIEAVVDDHHPEQKGQKVAPAVPLNALLKGVHRSLQTKVGEKTAVKGFLKRMALKDAVSNMGKALGLKYAVSGTVFASTAQAILQKEPDQRTE